MSVPRYPGEHLLDQLGMPARSAAPAGSEARFPDGGSWRTELPSCEGPEVLAAALEEIDRLEVPIHRISQGSGIWMITDAEITEMVKACEERALELCPFVGPPRKLDIGPRG